MENLMYYIWKFFTGLTILMMIPLGTFLVIFVMNQGKFGWKEANRSRGKDNKDNMKM